MTRIIAGRARGRHLRVPKQGTRPTTDRVREAIFSSLDAQVLAEGTSWASLDVLDLFAGSGALGLEALSRGAAAVLLVERQADATRTIAANIAAVDLPGATLLRRDVRHLADQPPVGGPYALCLADPPYELPAKQVADLLEALATRGWLRPGCLLVVEGPAGRAESPLPADVPAISHRAYGDTAVWYGRIPSGDPGVA